MQNEISMLVFLVKVLLAVGLGCTFGALPVTGWVAFAS